LGYTSPTPVASPASMRPEMSDIRKSHKSPARERVDPDVGHHRYSSRRPHKRFSMRLGCVLCQKYKPEVLPSKFSYMTN